ncbi:CmpA/NrtA family ABC transporter substrate-binding protein [Rhodobacter maris]|uniref:NitT/TauT family transport system ATP-binding protein n=1 Tax=Rhodobacter maris TaxID=446682 RepID=A0A285RKM2_9RHOB|nr:CmpA/NrtA family ABC transporter substrate-binding protein [Rhodobacter maris]SOB94643.1 NitT/TauT family transport system ATP-binding protein [Rhodobacter maris]
MTGRPITAGYIPLVDAAPLIIAREIGFAEQEGLALTLRAAPSWSLLRDQLLRGQIAAAHMLFPMPIAAALGLGGAPSRVDILQVLSLNGNSIGVSRDLAQKMRAAGHGFDFADALAAGAALIAARSGPLRVGVPFPFSMHAELLHHWFAALGLRAPDDFEMRSVPPPLMAKALGAGEIDAFCVGAPWGSIAVELGVGEMLLPGTAIRATAPEKVLAVRHDWAEAEPALTRALMRAVWQATRWLGAAENLLTAAEILARPDYLDLPPELIERSLTGDLVISPRGEMRATPGYMTFHAGAASFPWASQAALVATRLAARHGLAPDPARAAARAICRTDLYAANLADLGADLPAARDKIEGGLHRPTAFPAKQGKVILPADAFFDGWIFDPSASA